MCICQFYTRFAEHLGLKLCRDMLIIVFWDITLTCKLNSEDCHACDRAIGPCHQNGTMFLNTMS